VEVSFDVKHEQIGYDLYYMYYTCTVRSTALVSTAQFSSYAPGSQLSQTTFTIGCAMWHIALVIIGEKPEVIRLKFRGTYPGI
jgi:hypothetical protein